ncbi:unnamed protein product [Paramecium sonneborni]|uniref:Uncharacterized protein n=1 Tax=Paramecium sonneborni TaxID=65129 RepID=A0A8S1KPN1_9CILI|nr:unnamed protein product [Paramecium sonneborni]CAD8056749.1 unnamed protein product [Paramecium sonneborni]
MGNECKQCTQDAQSVIIQNQQIIQTQPHQYSFGMNHIDDDINFEFSSIDLPTIPQFGLEQKKIKADFLPPQALNVVTDHFSMTQSDNEDNEESFKQQINEETGCNKQIQRFQSGEENFTPFQSISKGNIIGSNLTTSSELQIQQQQSSRSIQKQRQLIWDSRTVNQELKQKKNFLSNSGIKFIEFEQKSLKKDVQRRNIQKKRSDSLIKKYEQKILNPSSKKDEIYSQLINHHKYLQKCVLDEYD